MAAPYLNEIHLGREISDHLKAIMHDVAEEFGVRGAVDPRPVPHITLFGPYDTDDGPQAKRIVKDIVADYETVPYRIDGFGCFEDKNVIYANVVPSSELRSLRRELSRRLRPISRNFRPWDSDYFYEFHITIAYRDIDEQFDEIWRYVQAEFDPQFDDYATRVVSLRDREIMWGYDLVRGQKLSRSESKDTEEWGRTRDALNERTSPCDYDSLSPQPDPLSRFAKSTAAKAMGRWH